MREEALVAALRRHYAIDGVSVASLPGGEDAFAWVYRVDTGRAGERYLVKVREANESRDVAAAVSRHLHEAGVRHVVAPLRSSAGSLTVAEGGFSLSVYPFVEGRTGVEAGLGERQWRALGSLARSLHGSVLPPELSGRLETETYRPAELEVISRIDQAVAARSSAGGRVAEEIAPLWTAHRAEILALVAGTERLGPLLERLSRPHVLCHADLHTWNVMVDGDGELWLIDWDDVVLAPKERDLMFVVGGIGAGLIAPHETAWFFEGYGETTVDPVALAYYRHAWAVQDVAGYAERVFLDPELGDEGRTHAARILTGLFDPGGIVELALEG
jgi:spectinomycin phosphotransferase